MKSMPPINIISVVGARPNFMKMAPVHKAFKNYPQIRHLICHTGQHYDEKMSKAFFHDLQLPKPDYYLGIGSGSHAEQTAKIMIAFEKVLLQEKPDLVIVYGDVNSTVACALTAVKLGIKVAHVEAGLRSGDRSMPEEINRIITDAISDYLFVSEPSGSENLKHEGIPDDKVFFVGNTMIDSLVEFLPKAEKSKILNKFCLVNKSHIDPYILVTLHRPSNVDNKNFLENLITQFARLGDSFTIVFPIHPRTKKKLVEWKLLDKLAENFLISDPIPYIDFIALVKNAAMVITDSGGIQEETTYLGIPCLTLRENTERPVTLMLGTNKLIGSNLIDAINEANNIINGQHKAGVKPELWDGTSALRITEILLSKKA